MEEPRLASTGLFFFFPDCSGTLRLFEVTGLKVRARGQQTFFFFCECVWFKKPRVAVKRSKKRFQMLRNLCLLGISSVCQWAERSWEQQHAQTAITHTHTHATSFYIIRNTQLRLFLGSAVRVFFIFGRNQYIWFGLNDGGVIHKSWPAFPDRFCSGVPFQLSECQSSSQCGGRNICILRSLPALV